MREPYGRAAQLSDKCRMNMWGGYDNGKDKIKVREHGTNRNRLSLWQARSGLTAAAPSITLALHYGVWVHDRERAGTFTTCQI